MPTSKLVSSRSRSKPELLHGLENKIKQCIKIGNNTEDSIWGEVVDTGADCGQLFT